MLPASRMCATTGLEVLEEVYKLELADTFTLCLDHARILVDSGGRTCHVNWQIAQLSERVVSNS